MLQVFKTKCHVWYQHKQKIRTCSCTANSWSIANKISNPDSGTTFHVFIQIWPFICSFRFDLSFVHSDLTFHVFIQIWPFICSIRFDLSCVHSDLTFHVFIQIWPFICSFRFDLSFVHSDLMLFPYNYVCTYYWEFTKKWICCIL